MKAQPPSESQLLSEVTDAILKSLPPRWSAAVVNTSLPHAERLSLVLEIEAPADKRATLVVLARRMIEPREVVRTADEVRSIARPMNGIPVIAAGYLSPRTRELLIDEDMAYADTTGNIRIVSESPGLFILTTGAQHDPWPRSSSLQSLRGRGSSRAIRALIDFMPPFGIRELAAKSGASPASLSRVAGLLEREALIVREGRGKIAEIDWQNVIRRWATDYDQLRSNTAHRFLAPRGLSDVRTRITDNALPVAATGAFAAQQFDPVAPARTATMYTTDPAGLADVLELRETDGVANVILLEPYDPVVFERTIGDEKLTIVAASQLAVDLLTGPGREPSQGEAILDWMKDNERAWRA